jgi:cytoskeletal protein CcmA (bactofilin family)
MMFSKPNGKMETLIGAHTEFRGELNVQGTLRVDGRVDGKLKADWVILSDTAIAKGEITAQRIMVGGTVEGNLRAREVEIKASGKVLGEILTDIFSVSAGGKFNGTIEMKNTESKVAVFPPNKQETRVKT